MFQDFRFGPFISGSRIAGWWAGLRIDAGRVVRIVHARSAIHCSCLVGICESADFAPVGGMDFQGASRREDYSPED